MAIALAQSKIGAGQSAFTSSVTAGNLIVVLGVFNTTSVTASDSLGNTYTLQESYSATSGAHHLMIFTAPVTTGGTCTQTFSYSPDSLALYEFSGIAASPIDVATGAGDFSGAHTYTFSFTTAVANEVAVIAGFASNSPHTTFYAVTLPSGWTDNNGSGNTWPYAYGRSAALSVGSNTATITSSGQYTAGVLLTIKPGSSTPATVAITGAASTSAPAATTQSASAGVTVTGALTTLAAGIVVAVGITSAASILGAGSTVSAGSVTTEGDSAYTISGAASTSSPGVATGTGTATAAVTLTGASSAGSPGTLTLNADGTSTLTGASLTSAAGSPVAVSEVDANAGNIGTISAIHPTMGGYQSATVTIPSTTLGNLLVVTYLAVNTTTTVSDNVGSSYSHVTQNYGGYQLVTAYALNVKSGATTLTFTSSQTWIISAIEYTSGGPGLGPFWFDKSSSASGTSTAASVPSLTPTNSNELLICSLGSIANTTSVSIPTGFTNCLSGGGLGVGKFGLASSYLVQTTAMPTTAPSTVVAGGGPEWMESVLAFYATDTLRAGSITTAGVVTTAASSSIGISGASSSATAGIVQASPLSVSIGITGAGLTSTAGVVTAFNSASITGTGSTTTAGIVTASGSAAYTISGSVSTSSSGTVTESGAASRALTGSATTSSSGVLTLNAAGTSTLTGATLNTTAGVPTVIGSVGVSGASSASAAGVVTVSTTNTIFIIGASSISAAGVTTETGNGLTAISGASTTSTPGLISEFGAVSASTILSGASSTSTPGHVAETASASTTLSGSSSSVTSGQVSETGSASTTIGGVSSTSNPGHVAETGSASTYLSGVALASQAGTVVPRLQASLAGAGGLSSPGTVIATGIQNVSVFLGGSSVSSSAGALSIGNEIAAINGMSSTCLVTVTTAFSAPSYTVTTAFATPSITVTEVTNESWDA